MTEATVSQKGNKWVVSVFWGSCLGGSEEETEYASFKEAYRAAREESDDVEIDCYPEWMRADMEAVENEIERGEMEKLRSVLTKRLSKLPTPRTRGSTAASRRRGSRTGRTVRPASTRT